MRAALIDRYGPPEVVRIAEVPDPTPGPDELLVRIRATTVNSGDARVRALRVPRGLSLMMRLALGWNGPRQKIGGFEAAGIVEQVGANVTRFRVGDRVVASHGFKFGLHAERATFTESDAVAKIPDGMSDVDAVALLFGGATAKYFFRKGGLKAGQNVLINGASGAVGIMAVQLARAARARVTAVCSSRNAALMLELGADRVIAYDRADFTQDAARFDLIMDNHGNAPFGRVRHMLKPGGRFLMVIGDLWGMLTTPLHREIVPTQDDGTSTTAAVYASLLEMAEEGTLRPVIDTVLPFEEIVAAHRRVDGGHKVGSVVLTFGD